MTSLLVATHNQHKLTEVRQILGQLIAGISTANIVAYPPGAPEPVEDGVTFTENALIKARSACQVTGLASLADDSGIVVDILGGSPGIFSARWCGYHGDDTKNRHLLLAQLADVPQPHRGAAFVCAAALVTPSGEEYVATGEVAGQLLTAERGDGGFGYDPIFVPNGHTQTTAEMTAEQKNALSHRAAALEKLADPIRQILVPASS